MPTRAQLEAWAEGYVAHWNAGDKPAWVRNWKSVAPGEIRMLDPVGTPEKRGFEACCAGPFDLFQPKVRFRIHPGSFFICANEVAWLLENRVATGDGERVHLSIETYRFEPDGACVIRTYYRVPEAGDAELGALFESYLPGR